MKNKIIFIQLIIGFLSVLTGIFLYITHYNKEVGSFLIKAGLIFEIVSVIKLFWFNKKALVE